MSRQMCLRCADPLSEGFGVLAKAPSGKRDFQAMQEAWISVPRLMQDFERGPLREYTPCSFDTTAAQATALTIVLKSVSKTSSV
jgi:hypothetical protein